MSSPETRNFDELADALEKSLKSWLSGRRGIDEHRCEWNAFAQATALYVLTFQHVFNSTLPESALFHSYTNDGDHESLVNLDYTSDGKRIEHPVSAGLKVV